MRIKKRRAEEAVDVSMSPLIDCVFLLLIFFLVTTMMKKKERRIPIHQPSATVGLAAEIKVTESYIGIKSDGSIVKALKQRDKHGRFLYKAVPDLEAHLDTLRATGKVNEPLVIQVQEDVEFQTLLKVFDACTIAGFKNVKTYLEMDDFQLKYTGEKDKDKKKGGE